MAVHYRCKRCGETHPSPVPFAEKLYFDAAVTLDLEFECPKLEETAVYNKTDMFWKEPDTVRAT